jgi:Ser/Thr protein kinase RdoA (MazF antagonist)
VQKNKKSVEWKGKKIVLDGKPYVIRLNEEGKPTNQVYDYDAYMQALNNPNINIPLRGKLAKKDGKHFLNTNN